MIARIFSGEFSAHLPASPTWFDGGQSYIVIDRGDDGKGSNVVLYDTATGQKRETLITAAQLTPAGAKEPLNVEALSWSTDKNRALVFTNSHPTGFAIYGFAVVRPLTFLYSTIPAP